MCVLERACWCRSRVLLHGGAQGAAVSEWCVRFGTGLLVLLQGAAVRVCWCCCRVPLLQGVLLLCAPWSWLAGATEGCRCRVQVQGNTVKGLLQGTAVRVRCGL